MGSGAWETREANRLLLGILHVETTTVSWAMGFRRLLIPGPVLPVTGMPFDHARNTICQAALNNNFQWVGFLDSDVIPEPDAYLRLLAHNKPIVSGVYFRRSPPHGFPVAQKAMNGGRTWLNHLPFAGLIDVDVVGAGLLVIRRDVLELFAKNPVAPGHNWFHWGVDQRGLVPNEIGESEDFSFCNVARKRGIPVRLDCGVRARHVGFGQAEHGSFLPAEVK